MNNIDFSIIDIVGIGLIFFCFLVSGTIALDYIPENFVTISIVLGSGILGAILTGIELVRTNLERLGWKGVIGIGFLMIILNLTFVIFRNR